MPTNFTITDKQNYENTPVLFSCPSKVNTHNINNSFKLPGSDLSKFYSQY